MNVVSNGLLGVNVAAAIELDKVRTHTEVAVPGSNGEDRQKSLILQIRLALAQPIWSLLHRHNRASCTELAGRHAAVE